MNKLTYLLLKGSAKMFAIIPFKILYAFSNFVAFVLRRLVRYRYEVIETNLQKAFPGKTSDEIKSIIPKVYLNLSDMILETLRGYYSKTSVLLKRYKCLNPEVVNKFYEEGRDVIFAMSHYGNWEWGTQVASRYFKHELHSFYKPLSNNTVDKFINENRLSHGMKMESIYKTKFLFRRSNQRPKAFFMLSDQIPINLKSVHWIQFMNQDTACLPGIETYARMFDIPVIFVDVQRVKRGHYMLRLETLSSSPKLTRPGEITRMYMDKLESILKKKPEDWLWSHRRWKRKRQVQMEPLEQQQEQLYQLSH
jgi:Kdo2-lipid IVA lauroyltransferase/acyltransferase